VAVRVDRVGLESGRVGETGVGAVDGSAHGPRQQSTLVGLNGPFMELLQTCAPNGRGFIEDG
jgi:hypothetical protein